MTDQRRAAFLDRDGVINVDHGYVSQWEQFELIPGVVEALKSLHAAGYLLVVVTNQSGIGRGLYTEAEVVALHNQLNTFLQANASIEIAGFYHCPHHPAEAHGALKRVCDCRKPAPGMILAAADDLNIDLADSILVGDKASDIEAGMAAGVGRLFRVGGERSGDQPEAISVTGLADVVRILGR